MQFLFLFGFLLGILKAAQISYAKGNFTILRYQVDSGFSCQNGASYTKTITFPGTFANVPQFIFSSFYYDSDKATINEFTLSISSITTTQCSIKISCVKQRLYGYMFNWVAIDDKRIEVINNLNANVTGLSSQKFTFTHSNINALWGFITTTSFGFKGSIAYTLTIDSINTTHVTVQYTTSTTYLLSIGYQIVLGTAESITQSELITKTSMTSTSYYTSPVLTQQSGYTLITPISGMSFTPTQNLRLYQQYDTTTTTSGTTIKYTLQTWDVSTLGSLTHRQVWINYQNSKVIYPLRLKKMRVTQKYSTDLDANAWKLSISELNLIYTSATTQTLLVSSSIQTLTLAYIYYCQAGKKIQGQILNCPTCVQQFQSFSQYCYPQINSLQYYIVLNQPDLIYDKIELVVTATGFQITESVQNQYSSTSYTIISLSVVDQ